MEKFTKGPWGFHLDGTIRNEDCSSSIVKVTPIHITMTDEDKANAKLIAAAPELFHALSDLLDIHMKTIGLDEFMNSNDMDKFCKLLAKAEG